MQAWADAAALGDDVEGACGKAGVTMAAFQTGRRADPGFDLACRVHDEVMDLKITESLRREAVKGKVPAQSLYFHLVRGILLGPDAPGHVPAGGIVDPGAAEGMVRAGLDYLGGFPRQDPGRDAPASTPSPASSRPDPPRSHPSKVRAPARKSGAGA